MSSGRSTLTSCRGSLAPSPKPVGDAAPSPPPARVWLDVRQRGRCPLPVEETRVRSPVPPFTRNLMHVVEEMPADQRPHLTTLGTRPFGMVSRGRSKHDDPRTAGRSAVTSDPHRGPSYGSVAPPAVPPKRSSPGESVHTGFEVGPLRRAVARLGPAPMRRDSTR